LFNELTVSQNLYLGTLGPEHGHMAMIRRYDSDADRMRRVNRVADSIGLTHRLNAYAADLSHGERRQLEFGLAIASEPRFIMLDEPAAGLSADERRVILEMLKLLDDRITLLLIEHDMDIALRAAQRVAVMHEGRIIAVGSPDEITSSEQVQQVYLGSAFHE
jgi:branched-chain amino acid transport system ATP-binding protein